MPRAQTWFQGRNLTSALLMVVAIFMGPILKGSTLLPIPLATWRAGQTGNQGRAISPDGRYVVGPSFWTSPGDGDGFLYDTWTGALSRPSGTKYPPSMLTGVGYRNDPMFGIQLVIDGITSGGYHADYCVRDSGWGAQVLDGTPGRALPVANSLAATTNSHIFYTIIGNYADDINNQRVLYTCVGSNAWSTAVPCKFTALGFNIGNPDAGNMCGVATNGRAVGWYRDAWLDGGLRHNFVIDFPPPPPLSYANTWDFPGLDGTVRGEAWSVSANGTRIFGRSPVPTDPDYWHGYKALVGTRTNSWIRTDPLPDLPGTTTGSTRLATPYGCTADGRYAVGMNYTGEERAVLWDTGDSNPARWTVVDLTERAANEGILGNFTRLYRAFSVCTNAAGNPVITGVGSYPGGYDRAFIMVLTAPVPRILTIAGAGTASVTVVYTNTMPGTNYTLQYSTNLSSSTWYTAGSKAAMGTGDSQADSADSSGIRYYRLSYTAR